MGIPRDYLDRPVAVIGAGTLGRRIALMFATRGGLVRINERNADRAAAAVDYVHQQLDELLATHRGWLRPAHDAFDFSVASPAAMNAGARYLLKRGYR